MSGPKSSRYTLTPEQRRILEAQRERERRCSVAKASIKRNNGRLLQLGAFASKAKEISIALTERFGNDGGFSSALAELEEIIAPVAPAIANVNAEDVDALEAVAKMVEASAEKAETLKPGLMRIAAENEVKLTSALRSDVDRGFATSFADALTGRSAVQKRIDALRVELLQLKGQASLSVALVEQIAAALDKLDSIESEDFLKNYASVTVTPLLKKCRAYIDEAERCYGEFEKLYGEYKALCELYYYVPQEYPCTEASVEILKSEIARINEEAAHDHEQAYISDCLDEVMEEMGYSVIGTREVTKRNGRRFRNELYSYGEGTAVNITYSSDGKIAMELGGIDDKDRLPDERETAALCASMERFCGDFKEIERRLLVRGVILAERISMLPVSAEYAQIINTSDYQMTETTESLQAKNRRRTVKKRKNLRQG